MYLVVCFHHAVGEAQEGEHRDLGSGKPLLNRNSNYSSLDIYEQRFLSGNGVLNRGSNKQIIKHEHIVM